MTNPIRGVLGNDPAGDINPAAGAKTGRGAPGDAVGPAPAGADSANVGQTQSLLETINATVGGVPAIDQNRVDALRQAIANGSYKVDPQQVAKGLIQSDAALAGPGKD